MTIEKADGEREETHDEMTRREAVEDAAYHTPDGMPLKPRRSAWQPTPVEVYIRAGDRKVMTIVSYLTESRFRDRGESDRRERFAYARDLIQAWLDGADVQQPSQTLPGGWFEKEAERIRCGEGDSPEVTAKAAEINAREVFAFKRPKEEYEAHFASIPERAFDGMGTLSEVIQAMLPANATLRECGDMEARICEMGCFTPHKPWKRGDGQTWGMIIAGTIVQIDAGIMEEAIAAAREIKAKQSKPTDFDTVDVPVTGVDPDVKPGDMVGVDAEGQMKRVAGRVVENCDPKIWGEMDSPGLDFCNVPTEKVRETYHLARMKLNAPNERVRFSLRADSISPRQMYIQSRRYGIAGLEFAGLKDREPKEFDDIFEGILNNAQGEEWEGIFWRLRVRVLPVDPVKVEPIEEPKPDSMAEFVKQLEAKILSGMAGVGRMLEERIDAKMDELFTRILMPEMKVSGDDILGDVNGDDIPVEAQKIWAEMNEQEQVEAMAQTVESGVVEGHRFNERMRQVRAEVAEIHGKMDRTNIEHIFVSRWAEMTETQQKYFVMGVEFEGTPRGRLFTRWAFLRAEPAKGESDGKASSKSEPEEGRTLRGDSQSSQAEAVPEVPPVQSGEDVLASGEVEADAGSEAFRVDISREQFERRIAEAEMRGYERGRRSYDIDYSKWKG